MLRKSTSVFVAALATLSMAAASFAQAPTADEVIEKSIAAKGGREKMKAISALRMTGKMLVGPGIEAPFTLDMARPAKMRMEFSIQGMTAVQTFDGEAGWALMPFLGKKEAEAMAEDDLKQARDQADIDGALVDYKDKGHAVEMVGKEDIEGTPAYKLKVTKKNGDIQHVFIDAESFLDIKVTSKNTVRGQEIETETSLGDYKEVAGVLMPYSIQSQAKGAPAGQGGFAMTIEKIEANPSLAADHFGKPTMAGAAEGAPK